MTPSAPSPDRDNAPARSRPPFAVALVFSFAGAMHFFAPAPYVGIMPPYLPHPLALVYISGAAEILGGIGVLFAPPIRRFAGCGLILLLVAVFPANVQMALHGATIGGRYLPPGAPISWIRLPLQLLLIYWVARATRWRSR